MPGVRYLLLSCWSSRPQRPPKQNRDSSCSLTKTHWWDSILRYCIPYLQNREIELKLSRKLIPCWQVFIVPKMLFKLLGNKTILSSYESYELSIRLPWKMYQLVTFICISMTALPGLNKTGFSFQWPRVYVDTHESSWCQQQVISECSGLTQ